MVLSCVVRTIKNVTFLRSGDLLVECATRAQSTNLQKAKLLGNIEIKVYPHKTLNSCRAILRDPRRYFSDMSEFDMIGEFRSQGVTNVRRFTIRKNGEIIHTNTYLLTFSLTTPPHSIKAGFVSVPLHTYIPNPVRCFKCQKYGHGASSCRGVVHCANCGETSHDTSDCKASTHYCLNCKGDHAASSKDCPIWKREKRINEVKCSQNIFYQEARKIILAGLDSSNTSVSYSAAVKSKTSFRTVACQSDITWLNTDQPQIYSEPPSTTEAVNSTLVSEGCQTSPHTSPSTSRSPSPNISHKSKQDKAKPPSAVSTKQPKSQKTLLVDCQRH